MNRGKETGMSIKHLVPLAALVALGGCMGDNLGLDSVHQPIVAGGVARVPNCPDWSSQGKDSAASTDSNYGCAVNSNLAAMIADPADLLRGRRAEGSDAEIATRAIRAWREVPPSGKNGLDKVTAKGGPQ